MFAREGRYILKLIYKNTRLMASISRRIYSTLTTETPTRLQYIIIRLITGTAIRKVNISEPLDILYQTNDKFPKYTLRWNFSHQRN